MGADQIAEIAPACVGAQNLRAVVDEVGHGIAELDSPIRVFPTVERDRADGNRPRL